MLLRHLILNQKRLNQRRLGKFELEVEYHEHIQYKQMLNTAQQQQQGQQMGGEEQGGDENDLNSLIQRQKEARGGEEKMEDNVFHSFTIENPFVKDLDNFVEKAFINKQ